MVEEDKGTRGLLDALEDAKKKRKKSKDDDDDLDLDKVW